MLGSVFIISVILATVTEANVVPTSDRARQENRNLCSGARQEIHLTDDFPSTVESVGLTDPSLLEDCLQQYDVILSRPSSDLGQWRIKIEVEYLNFDCEFGYLQVVEDGEQRQNIKACNGQRKDVRGGIFSHEHLMSLRLKTGKCPTAGGCEGQGVKLKISAQYVCGGSYTAPTGTITSPFYPKPYVNSMACIYDIRAPKGMRIKMSCPAFNLSERGSDKTFFQSLETFHTYYGNDLEGKTLKTRRHIDTFYFLSNNVKLDSKSHYGFNCTYSFF